MKKVMTLLLILVLSGCTRLSIGNETVETKKEEKESIVKCDGEDNKTITFFSKGDELYAMQFVFFQELEEFIQSLNISGTLSNEEISKYINSSLSKKYKDIKGVSAIGEILEDKIQYTIMIDFDEADFDQLVENGLLNSGEVESQYISLKKTKEAYQNNGYACENQ